MVIKISFFTIYIYSNCFDRCSEDQGVYVGLSTWFKCWQRIILNLVSYFIRLSPFIIHLLHVYEIKWIQMLSQGNLLSAYIWGQNSQFWYPALNYMRIEVQLATFILLPQVFWVNHFWTLVELLWAYSKGNRNDFPQYRLSYEEGYDLEELMLCRRFHKQ